MGQKFWPIHDLVRTLWLPPQQTQGLSKEGQSCKYIHEAERNSRIWRLLNSGRFQTYPHPIHTEREEADDWYTGYQQRHYSPKDLFNIGREHEIPPYAMQTAKEDASDW